MTKRRQKKANATPASRIDPTTIQVVAPTDKYANIRILFETITVIALLMSLSISFMHMRSARQKELDAAEALSLANAALGTSRQAQILMKQQEQTLTDLQRHEESTRQRAGIAYLTVRAESGDRAAFNELWDMISDDLDVHFATQTPEWSNILRILSMYNDESIKDPLVDMVATGPAAPPGFFYNQSPVESLDSISRESRAHGLNTIRRMRLYEYIPRLIEMIPEENDLHILQMLGMVLTDLLHSAGYNESIDFYELVISTDLTVERLHELWRTHSNDLLSIKPRYWERVGNPPNSVKWMLSDPDAEQETGGDS